MANTPTTNKMPLRRKVALSVGGTLAALLLLGAGAAAGTERVVEKEVEVEVPVIEEVEVVKEIEVPVIEEVEVVKEIEVPVIEEVEVPVEDTERIDALVRERDGLAADHDTLLVERDDLATQVEDLEAEVARLEAEVAALTAGDSTAADQAADSQVLMPDVVGMNLQTAQDLIQDAGVFLSLSEDASGQDRTQLWDRNWFVVEQSPAPGTPITEGDPLLSVLKYTD